MRTQQEPGAVRLWWKIECVVHVPGWVTFGEIQLGKVVIVGFDIGTFRNRKPHIGENCGEFVDYLTDRMHAPNFCGRFAHRQCDVNSFAVEPCLEHGSTKLILACYNC